MLQNQQILYKNGHKSKRNVDSLTEIFFLYTSIVLQFNKEVPLIDLH